MYGRGGGGGRGGGRGRGGAGAYYKAKYGGGGRGGGRGGGGGRGADLDDLGGSSHREQAQHAPRGPRGTSADLAATLRRIDGKPYGAYRDILGAWDFGGGAFALVVDRVQSDLFAPPSRARAIVPAAVARFPPELRATPTRRVALADFLARRFHALVTLGGLDRRRGDAGGGWSSAKGGELGVDPPGQHVLARTSVLVNEAGDVEGRFTVALPAAGRSIQGAWAARVLVEALPGVVESALTYFGGVDAAAATRHAESVEDQRSLRAQIRAAGLVAFVRDGAILPRSAGNADTPMTGEGVVAFRSPESLRAAFDLPNSGSVTGMAIRAGVTLVVGGGFHGKSTLLRALELGCYDHVPGDGREFVVCDPTAVKIRAEDGRGVERVDISPFISNLPFGKRTDAFSTPDASGSTSQAANIMEALEVGCEVLLIDEDTAATNFMIRSAEMRRLVSLEKEPITPFIAKVRALADVGPDPDVTGPGPGPGPGDGASGVTPPTGVTPRRVSSILVLGGSGDYFAVADTVICMENYAPRDVTAEAAAIARDAFPPGTIHVDERFGKVAARVPDPSSVDAGARPPKVPTTETILWGDDQREIRLGAVEQLCERGQTRFIAEALAAMARTGCVDGGRTTAEALDALEALIAGGDGMDAVGGTRGDLALPRRFEIAAALNRLRGVRMTQRGRSARS